MRLGLVTLLMLVTVPAAQAKELTSVLVVGPAGPAMVEPYRIVQEPFAHLQLIAPPAEPYVLVFPMIRGVPARPGRWYPRAGVVCSGWRSGVEAGCATAPRLRGWLGRGIATGLYRSEPVRLTRLLREGTALSPYGNEATAVKLALHQRGTAASEPTGCTAYRARWTKPGWPATFCISSAGGLYARGRVYPLPAAAASFVNG